MRHANPFENLIKRQRVLDEKREVMRNGQHIQTHTQEHQNMNV